MNDLGNFTSLESYELALVFSPTIGESGATSEVEELKKLITSGDGEVFFSDFWGLHDLAYMINKESQGFYVVLNFKSPTEKIKDLEKTLNIHPTVLRYLIIKAPVNYQVKSFEQYHEENEKLKQAKEKEQTDKKEARAAQLNKTRNPEPAIEKKSKVEKPVFKPKAEKPVEEKIEKVKEKEKKESKLDDFDEKLKNIINDPDISL